VATHDGALYVRIEVERPCVRAECSADPNAPKVVRVDGVAVSTDGGKTWNQHEGAWSQPRGHASFDAFFSFAVGLTYRVDETQRTLELNGTRLRREGLDPEAELVSLRVDKQVAGGLYGLARDGEDGGSVVRSTDGGRTWTRAPLAISGAALRPNAIATDDVDGRLYVSTRAEDGVARLYVSADQGESLIAAGGGLPESERYEVVAVPHTRCAAFAFADGAIYRTTDGGGTCSQ
jgi:photosystem II stability/assembly factor-like uncharacterized protein